MRLHFLACAAALAAPGALTVTHGARAGAEPGRWAFEPARDAFSEDALFDLRSLNEKEAGQSGFVKRSRDGNDFVLGNGKPVRFWSLNTGAYNKHPKFPAPDLARHARFMAKRGVNMARFHGNITPSGNDLMDIEANERDHLWRLVAAMKKEGIYTTASLYWAVSARWKSSWGVLDSGGAKAMGLLFFDPKLQEAYKGWLRKVFAERNPHTGIPLAQDPALAIIQIQNEDSLLFWTSQNIKGAAKTELRRQFGRFLEKKYGSLEKARAAWGAGSDVPPDQDSPDAFDRGEAALFIIWELTQFRGGPGRQARAADQMEFFTRVMYDFNRMIGRYLRDELGCRQLVNAGNWRAADNVRMLDAERYSYSANEVMGVNRYYTGIHKGQHTGWAIVNGDQFTDDSVLLRPRHLPVNLKQVEGFPIIVPESSWVPPLGYQSEGPFLVAAYSSLTGVDSYYWFATGEEDWRHPSSANGYLPSLGKWVCHTPMIMGQWPAAALMFRKGYVKRGETAVLERRALADLWARRNPVIAEDPGFDPNRDKGNIAPESNVPGGLSPLAFLVGPVVTEYDADPAKSKLIDLAKYIDEGAKTVRSVTGELELDYGKGICTLDAPKAQGVAGFLNRVGTFRTSDLVIRSGNDYAAVLAVSLDGKPIKTSQEVLVQVGTVARPTGWRTTRIEVDGRDGERIDDYGRAPWQIVNGDVTIGIANSRLARATVLDMNGEPVRDIDLARSGRMKAFEFPKDAMYVCLRPRARGARR